MILPIVAYGDPILKKDTVDIDIKSYTALPTIIDNMFETMYAAHGVGLAAPQIGLTIRLFVMDSARMYDEGQEGGVKKAFINPELIDETGEEWTFSEGCLSIPGVRGEVTRHKDIVIRYQDLSSNWHEESFTSWDARVIQHEYDHLDGILFTEYLPSLRKQLLKTKLNNISKGNVEVDYRMKFPK